MIPIKQDRSAGDIEPHPAILVCLNPQQDQVGHLTRASARSVAYAVKRMEFCLRWARARHIAVFHVFTPGASLPGHTYPAHAMSSLRPRPDETVVFKGGLSFFDSHEFTNICKLSDGAAIYVIGFSLAADCLVSAIDAARAGRTLVLVKDAIASFDLPPYSAAESEGVVIALLAQFCTIATSEDLSSSFSLQPKRNDHGQSRH